MQPFEIAQHPEQHAVGKQSLFCVSDEIAELC